LVRSLIYPVPDPAFPFLGVHFTRMIDGEVEWVRMRFWHSRGKDIEDEFNLRDAFEIMTWPGFRQVAGKYWKMGAAEYYRSFSKKAFVRALQRMVPEITENDLLDGGAGVTRSIVR